MDFEMPPAAEAFRKEVKAFLEATLPDWWRGFYVEDDERIVPLVRQVCETLAEMGWLTMAWPVEYGGADADIWKQMVLKEEMWDGRGSPWTPDHELVVYRACHHEVRDAGAEGHLSTRHGRRQAAVVRRVLRAGIWI